MSKIEAAVFDIGGVLVAPNRADGEDIQNRLGLNDEQMSELWNYYIPTLGSGNMDEAEFWKRTANRFHTIMLTPEDDVFGKIWEENLVIRKDLLGYVKQLGKRGIKLAALSDTNSSHARILKKHGVYEPFDRLFLSHETHIRKPAPEVYELVVNEMGIDPARTVFTDDNPVNLIPANDLGMQTVLAEDSQQIIRSIEATLK